MSAADLRETVSTNRLAELATVLDVQEDAAATHITIKQVRRLIGRRHVCHSLAHMASQEVSS